MGQIEEFCSNVWPNCKTGVFLSEKAFVHAKGLCIAVGICRTALVKPCTLKNCELSAGKSGARKSFLPYQIEGEDMACYQRKHPGNSFFTWISKG